MPAAGWTLIERPGFRRVVKLGHSEPVLLTPPTAAGQPIITCSSSSPSADPLPVLVSRSERLRSKSGALPPPASFSTMPKQHGNTVCITSEPGERIRLLDLNTGAGTYVNGMRVREHVLEPGDQIAVGDSVFVLREAAAGENEPDSSARVTLLRACTLLFLFKGVVTSNSPVQSELLEAHALSLISELLPCRSSALLLSADERALRELAEERVDDHAGLPEIVDKLLAKGPVTAAVEGYVAVPVYASGVPRGAIVAWFEASEIPHLEEHLEILSALSTLAAAALENVREIQELKRENEALQEQLTVDSFGIVGRSASMRKVMQLVQRVGPQDTTVLDPGRKWHRKGISCPRRSSVKSSPRQTVRRDQLRRTHGNTPRKRTLWA